MGRFCENGLESLVEVPYRKARLAVIWTINQWTTPTSSGNAIDVDVERTTTTLGDGLLPRVRVPMGVVS